MLLHYQPTHDNKVIRLKFKSNKDRQIYVSKYQCIVALIVQINETIKNAEDEKSKIMDEQSVIKKLNTAIELHDDLIDSYGANCLPDKFIHRMRYAQIAHISVIPSAFGFRKILDHDDCTKFWSVFPSVYS
jgi:hypothetical protein